MSISIQRFVWTLLYFCNILDRRTHICNLYYIERAWQFFHKHTRVLAKTTKNNYHITTNLTYHTHTYEHVFDLEYNTRKSMLRFLYVDAISVFWYWYVSHKFRQDLTILSQISKKHCSQKRWRTMCFTLHCIRYLRVNLHVQTIRNCVLYTLLHQIFANKYICICIYLFTRWDG